MAKSALGSPGSFSHNQPPDKVSEQSAAADPLRRLEQDMAVSVIFSEHREELFGKSEE